MHQCHGAYKPFSPNSVSSNKTQSCTDQQSSTIRFCYQQAQTGLVHNRADEALLLAHAWPEHFVKLKGSDGVQHPLTYLLCHTLSNAAIPSPVGAIAGPVSHLLALVALLVGHVSRATATVAAPAPASTGPLHPAGTCQARIHVLSQLRPMP